MIYSTCAAMTDALTDELDRFSWSL